MRPRVIHNPAAQSRARVFDRAERRLTGSDFSPLIDAFHPSFPASVEDYISKSHYANKDDPIHRQSSYDNKCLDGCPIKRNRIGHVARCRVNSSSIDRYSAESDCASDVLHSSAEIHGDNLLLSTNDPTFKLPSEVSDLILSYLSPAALDAARYTCKDWRTKILSNPWLLSSVLGDEKERPSVDGSPSSKLGHRDLLKKLDRDSALPSTSQHSDAWRTRFRTRNLEFSIPVPSSTPTRPAFVATARTGTQNGVLVLQLRGTDDHPESTLVIYCFDSAELPWYAGTIQNVKGQGALRITGVTEIRRRAAWVLRIDIGDTAGLYSLTSCEAFSKHDSRFVLKRLGSLEEVPTLPDREFVVAGLDRSPEPLPTSAGSWKILAAFPANGGLRHACFSKGLRQHTQPRFLAERTATGNVHVIMEIDAVEEPYRHAGYWQSGCSSNDSKCINYHFLGTALLSRPRPNSAYRNFEIAPTVTKDGIIRVAIVWQTTYLDESIHELYIYDIPEAVYYEPCKSYNHNTVEKASIKAEDVNEGAISPYCRLIQGKRVTSLDQYMGGIHPHSPLYELASPQEKALGGLQLAHMTEYQDTYPRNVQYQKCFIWGPTTSEEECTRISLKVFDFSFADPQRLHLFTAHGPKPGEPRDQTYHHIALKSLHCACALHDDGFRIVLPDLTAVEASTPVNTRRESNTGVSTSSWLSKLASPKDVSPPLNGIMSSFWARKPSTAQDSVEPNIGSISRNDSSARQAALERVQEWLRGRIVGMKRVGLTDFEIAELWNMSAWTQYGQVRKPEGWRELGVGEGRDN